MTFSALDIIVIFIYLTGCLLIGLYKSTKIKSLTEYSLGKAPYPSTIMAATIFATSISSYSTIGTIEKICNLGLFFVVAFLAKPIFFIVSANMLSKNTEKFKGCISITDIFEVLYGKSSKMLITVLSLFMCIGMVAIQVYAVSIILQSLGINSSFGTIISFIVLICYSTFGGIRAVAFTDLFQFLIFFVALPVVCSNAFFDIGGFSGIYKNLGVEYFNLNLSSKEWLSFASIFLFNCIPTLGPPIVQRTLMINSSVKISKIFNTNALFCIPFFLIIAIFGMIIRIKCKGSIHLEKEIIKSFVYGLPHGLVGLVVSGLLAVVMSTADSYLNTASIILTKDIFKKIFNKEEVLYAKIASFILGAGSIPIALKGMNIVDFFWSLSSLWTPVVFVPMVIGYYELCVTTKKLFWCSSIAGVLFSVLGFLFFQNFGPTSTLLGVLGSALAAIICAISSKEKKPKGSNQKRSQIKTIDDCVLLMILLIFASLPIFFLFDFKVIKNLTAVIMMVNIAIITADWIFLKNKDLNLSYMIVIASILFLWLFITYCFLPGRTCFLFMLPVSVLIFSFLSKPTEIFLLSVFISILLLSMDNIFAFKNSLSKQDWMIFVGYFFIGLSIIVYIKRYASYKIKPKERKFALLAKANLKLKNLNEELNNSELMRTNLESKIEIDKKFFNIMNQYYKKYQIENLLNTTEKNHIINSFPIIIYEKKEEEIIWEPIINDLKSIIQLEAFKEKINFNFIEKTLTPVSLNISNAAIHQILYSFVYNLITILKPESDLNITFNQNGSLLEIVSTYSGYGLSKKDLVDYIGCKVYVNPFLLNWKNLLKSFTFHGISYDIKKNSNGGSIKLQKLLKYKIFDFQQFKSQEMIKD